MIINEAVYRLHADDNLWERSDSSREFTYSDGDEVEARILNIVKNAKDRSVFSQELARSITDWPSRYHLSANRAGIVRPVIDIIGNDVLEIGAGCGAITRHLGECGKNVLALEGSRNRAHIAAERCADLKNVSVLVENIDQFNTDARFDTVLLIGVLEYARVFYSTPNDIDPCDALLLQAASLLKPGGRLILAIENQLGLKYFAGYPEDHLGEVFFGIENRYTDRSIVTFGRHDLTQKLGAAGFKSQKWWFPFPDYKVPLSVISEEGLRRHPDFNAGSLCSFAAAADPQRPEVLLFSQQSAWDVVHRNALVPDMANSFLVVASAQPIPDSAAFAYHFGFSRRPQFSKTVVFESHENGFRVTRHPLNPQLAEDKGATLRIKLETEDYMQGVHWYDALVSVVNKPDWTVEHIGAWARTWLDAVLAQSGIGRDLSQLSPHSMLSGEWIDAIPRNMIANNGRCVFIDQEWVSPAGIEIGFLIFRGIRDALLALESCARPGTGVPLQLDQLIIDTTFGLGIWFSREDIRRYKDMEHQFQERALGTSVVEAANPFGAEILPVRARVENFTRLHAENQRLHAEVEAKDRENTTLSDMLRGNDNPAFGEIESLRTNLAHTSHQYLHLTRLILDAFFRKGAVDETIIMPEAVQAMVMSIFDEKWYLASNPDVAAAGVDAFGHFINHGFSEGRAPNELWRV